MPNPGINLPERSQKGCGLSYVSVNSHWVHPPGQPRGLAQKSCPGGRDLTFESCPGDENSTRVGILWKMKLKLQKNSVDQIFTGENKKKTSRIFDLFRGLHHTYFFSMEFFLVYGSIFGSAVTHTLQKICGVTPGLFIWSFHWVMVIHTYFFAWKVIIMLKSLSVYWIY